MRLNESVSEAAERRAKSQFYSQLERPGKFSGGNFSAACLGSELYPECGALARRTHGGCLHFPDGAVHCLLARNYGHGSHSSMDDDG